METEVYGDILFLINASMDCLCFLLTARLLHRPLSRLRLGLGSVLGGVYAVLALLLDVGHLAALAIDITVCLLLCVLVFPPRTGIWKDMLTTTGVYLLVSFLLGGIMTGLYHVLNRTGLRAALAGSEEDSPTAWLFALLALCSGGIAALGGRLFQRAGANRSAPVTVQVAYAGKSVTLEGLVDSGNLLSDPVGGRPVIPVDMQSVSPLFSPALLALLQESRQQAPRPEALVGAPEASRIRLIPASTATGQGLLLAIRPDRLTLSIHTSKGDRVRTVDALVAPIHLPAAPDGGTAPQALVPAQL